MQNVKSGIPISRPPLERMLRIHQEIVMGKFPNATKLAEELEVSTKSIHRDIDFMRDRLQLPLEFDQSRNGWHYEVVTPAMQAVAEAVSSALQILTGGMRSL